MRAISILKRMTHLVVRALLSNTTGTNEIDSHSEYRIAVSPFRRDETGLTLFQNGRMEATMVAARVITQVKPHPMQHVRL
jgi:hypothetical protein